jgi:hypothetical protein
MSFWGRNVENCVAVQGFCGIAVENFYMSRLENDIVTAVRIDMSGSKADAPLGNRLYLDLLAPCLSVSHAGSCTAGAVTPGCSSVPSMPWQGYSAWGHADVTCLVPWFA